MAHVCSRLAGHEVRRSVDSVDELPRTPTGVSSWPRTRTATAARAASGGGDDTVSRSRTLEIVMDAAYAVPDRCGRSCTGDFSIDEDMPVESGVDPSPPLPRGHGRAAGGAHRILEPVKELMGLVDYAHHDRVARISLADGNRGNPLNQATVDELARAVRQARADDVHVVVLSAPGPRLQRRRRRVGLRGSGGTEQMVDDLAESLHRVVSELHRMDAVVVSVVHGTAAGAGVSLAAAADLVVAGSVRPVHARVHQDRLLS